MIEVTKKEFQDWIKEQPDDQPVAMWHNINNDSCGCAMVQYGKAKGWDFRGCGIRNWVANLGESDEVTAKFEKGLDLASMFQGEISSIMQAQTFGQLKSELVLV